jgi:multidrug efflux pump subunit AcrA (membrane-fusion protein)
MKNKLQKAVGTVIRFIKKHKKMAIVAGVIIVAGILALIFLRPDNSRSQTAAPAVTALSKTTLEQITTVTGTVSSASSRSVNAKASGEITEVLVSEGDTVKVGQVLARIDTSDIQLDITNAKNDVAEAEASANRNTTWAQEDLTNAQNSYNAANDAYNAAQSAYAAAQAACADTTNCPAADEKYQALKTAEQSRSQAESSLRQAQRSYDSQVASDSTKTARRQLENLQQQLKDYTITAPVAGTITEMNAEVGGSSGGSSSGAASAAAASSASSSSSSSSQSASSSALFVIEDVSSFKAELSVAEYDAMEIAVGNSARITADSIEDKTWDAKVIEVSPKVVSGNFTVEVAVLSPVENLKIGMSISADIITGSASDVFVVPYDAVVKNQRGESVVYAIEVADMLGGRPALNATQERREIVVTTGLETDYYIAISGEGLTAGTMILNDPNGVSVVSESSNQNNMFMRGGGDMPAGAGAGGGGMRAGGGGFGQ